MGFYTRFSPPPKPSISCGEGMTSQEFKSESDINLLIERYSKTGSYYPGNKPPTRLPAFEDVSQIPDFQSQMDSVIHAQAMFDALPSRVRDRFHNSPAELLQFCADEANRPEAERLGIIIAKTNSSTPDGAVVSPVAKIDAPGSKTEAKK